MRPSISIEKNILKPSHSGNTYTVGLTAIFNVKKLLKKLSMAFDQYLTCQIFPVQWARVPMKTSRIAQWVHLFSMVIEDFRPFYI